MSKPEKPGHSLWALAALPLSLAVLCPPASILGVLLGIRALVEIRTHPDRRGRHLAIAAVAIGMVTALAWLVLGIWWNANARRPMREGPAEALAAGFAGDVPGFCSEFISPGSGLDEVEAAAFIANLRSRYGRFIDTRLDREAETGGPANLWHPRIHYRLRFEREEVPAEVEFVVRDEVTGGFVLKFRWLVIRDSQLQELRFPASAEIDDG